VAGSLAGQHRLAYPRGAWRRRGRRDRRFGRHRDESRSAIGAAPPGRGPAAGQPAARKALSGQDRRPGPSGSRAPRKISSGTHKGSGALAGHPWRKPPAEPGGRLSR
jgi:hypothetical protein